MYKYFKRFFDILIAIFALICLSWVFIICMIILLCTGEHYIFYCQNRIGKNGKPFKIIKFATMLFNSPNMAGGTITRRNDPRVLPFGKFLRKTKINELPQLFNILSGEMSIIGPRPLTPKLFAYYSEDVQEGIGKMTPGLSGIGSVIFRDEEASSEGARVPNRSAAGSCQGLPARKGAGIETADDLHWTEQTGHSRSGPAILPL